MTCLNMGFTTNKLLSFNKTTVNSEKKGTAVNSSNTHSRHGHVQCNMDNNLCKSFPISNISIKLKLNKFIYPTVLCYHMGNYVFAVVFTFFVCCSVFKPKTNKKSKNPGQ